MSPLGLIARWPACWSHWCRRHAPITLPAGASPSSAYASFRPRLRFAKRPGVVSEKTQTGLLTLSIGLVRPSPTEFRTLGGFGTSAALTTCSRKLVPTPMATAPQIGRSTSQAPIPLMRLPTCASQRPRRGSVSSRLCHSLAERSRKELCHRAFGQVVRANWIPVSTNTGTGETWYSMTSTAATPGSTGFMCSNSLEGPVSWRLPI